MRLRYHIAEERGVLFICVFQNAAHDVHDLMNHVRWATESSAKYYSRYENLLDASNTAVRLAQSSERAKEIEIMFNEKANFGEMPFITDE